MLRVKRMKSEDYTPSMYQPPSVMGRPEIHTPQYMSHQYHRPTNSMAFQPQRHQIHHQTRGGYPSQPNHTATDSPTTLPGLSMVLHAQKQTQQPTRYTRPQPTGHVHSPMPIPTVQSLRNWPTQASSISPRKETMLVQPMNHTHLPNHPGQIQRQPQQTSPSSLQKTICHQQQPGQLHERQKLGGDIYSPMAPSEFHVEQSNSSCTGRKRKNSDMSDPPTDSSMPQDDDQLSTTSDQPAVTATAKNSRYLREMDRRMILSRIDKGEKQAALAKEYQVSRAAICNLNKHRDEVMSRKDENPLAKHPKKPRPKGANTKSSSSKSTKFGALCGTGSHKISSSPRGTLQKTGVHELKSRAVALLLTTLRNKNTSITDFRRCSERLMRLLIEEALSLVPIKAVEVFLNDQEKIDGVGTEHPPCAISMEQNACPMLEIFQALEPNQPTGYIRYSHQEMSLMDTRLPVSLNYHNVFIYDLVVSTADALSATIQRLQARGAVRDMITIVSVFISSDVIATIQKVFPGVKVITVHVDNSSQYSISSDRSSQVQQHQEPRNNDLDIVLQRFEQVYQAYNSRVSC